MKRPILYTIGHSTRPIDEFIAMLKSFQIETLIDVRTVPGSRFNPQFGQKELQKSLKANEIEYEHRPGLGGLRKPHKDSVNMGWRNASFRGYADYMQTTEFEEQLKALIEEAKQKTVVIMCAEAVPWRCHRSLIADALLTHKFDVMNIMDVEKATPHKLNPMAQIEHGRIHYPHEAT